MDSKPLHITWPPAAGDSPHATNQERVWGCFIRQSDLITAFYSTENSVNRISVGTLSLLAARTPTLKGPSNSS